MRACAQRSVVPCTATGVTQQGQLDDELRSWLASNDIQLIDLLENYLVVDFEAGCARRFYADRGDRAVTTELESLRAVLGRVRWACAQGLACAVVPGPSIIAAQ
jgi:hypothetical protein